MGYYTYYTLSHESLNSEQPETIPQCRHQAIPEDAAFCHVCGESIRAVPISEAIEKFMQDAEPEAYYGVLSEGEHCKWYEHDEPMRALSVEFPDRLFTLRGEGEESGDLWVKYYLNGKCQEAKAEITYAPFDEAKLK
jgi:hypothetical protein